MIPRDLVVRVALMVAIALMAAAALADEAPEEGHDSNRPVYRGDEQVA